MGKTAIALIVIMVFFGCCNMRNSVPLVIGHRGAMGHETENTLASVKKAMELNADMIEIDVFKIDSGEIVVFHDERLERLSNAGGRIEEYNIFDLRQVVLDGNHQIPMLQDVLKLINNQTTLNIELKGADTANRVNFILDYYVREKGWSWDNFLISSFNWDELKKMREANPDIAIAVLTEEDPLQAIPVAKELNAVAINPDYRQLTQEIVDKIQDAGFKVYTWTVNNPEDIEKMKEFGVDGIISDYPERVR
ncbi:glycerophosphoryl diester phosphodiesterase [Flagellimonas lutaonensis]|uniref:Glycerophosphoryl diester phosphodiesterase n=2 Tax=Flagellimonas lutaonensis TaxID=516051 RepID=A0A0D5YS43_9FLAO|nr:glycerophosphoryl diester phosphodiesterase [Allomuricauda lutaonensis]